MINKLALSDWEMDIHHGSITVIPGHLLLKTSKLVLIGSIMDRTTRRSLFSLLATRQRFQTILDRFATHQAENLNVTSMDLPEFRYRCWPRL